MPVVRHEHKAENPHGMFGKGLAFKNPDPNAFGVLPWAYLSLGFTL